MEQQTTLGHRLVSGTAWVFGGRVGSRAITLLVNVLVAKILVPASVGTLLLTIALVTVGATVARWGMESASIRLISSSLAHGEAGRARASVHLTLAWTLVGSGVVATLLAAGGWRWLSLHAFHNAQMAGLQTSAAVMLVALALQRTVSSWFNAVMAMRVVAGFEELAGSFLWCTSLLVLWLATGEASAQSVLWLRVLSLTLALGVMLALFRKPYGRLKQGNGNGQAPSIGELFDLGTTLMFTALVALVIGTTSDLAILAHYRPKAEVAAYGLAAALAQVVAIPFLSTTAVFAPQLAAIRDSEDVARLEGPLRAIVGAVSAPALVVALIFATGGGPLLGFLFGSSYEHAASILMALALAQFVFVVTGPCALALQMTGRQRLTFAMAVVTATCSVGADLFAAPRWGALGVAVATGSVLGAGNLVAVVVARRLTGLWTFARLRPRDVAAGLNVARDLFHSTTRRARDAELTLD